MPKPPAGPVRCPACGRKGLTLQTRCLFCNVRHNEVRPVETAAGIAAQRERTRVRRSDTPN